MSFPALPDGASVDGIPPLAVSVARAAELVGISRATAYKYVLDGSLRSFSVGTRRLVRVVDIEAWLARLVEGEPA